MQLPKSMVVLAMCASISGAASAQSTESAIRAAAPRVVTIASIAAMKRTWKVSVAALSHRLHDLGLTSDWHYKQFNIELSRRGRENEPAPVARESSAILRKTLAALAEDGVSMRDIAKDLCLPVSELQSLVFGLGVIEGGGASGAPRGALRVVT